MKTAALVFLLARRSPLDGGRFVSSSFTGLSLTDPVVSEMAICYLSMQFC